MKYRPHRVYAICTAIMLSLCITACGITPDMIFNAREDVATAQQVVATAQDSLDELRDNPDADAGEVTRAQAILDAARDGLALADAELATIESDESPEAGIVASISRIVAGLTGQPQILIGGTLLAGLIRENRRAAKRKADAIALAKSVQPAIDAANPETKQRIRDLQDGHRGIRDIVNVIKADNATG